MPLKLVIVRTLIVTFEASMFLESITNWITILVTKYWLWIMFESYIPLSRQFLRESLSITNATIPVKSDRSFDLITYGLTEDWLINWTVSYVKRLCFSRSPLKDPMSCADSTDVTINFSSSELKSKSLFSIFLENIGNKNLEHKT